MLSVHMQSTYWMTLLLLTGLPLLAGLSGALQPVQRLLGLLPLPGSLPQLPREGETKKGRGIRKGEIAIGGVRAEIGGMRGDCQGRGWGRKGGRGEGRTGGWGD